MMCINSLVPDKLVGRKNFVNSWKRNIEISLSVSNKLKFVLSQYYPKPTDPERGDIWQRCNDAILSWILASLSRSVHNHIWRSKDVVAAWKT